MVVRQNLQYTEYAQLWVMVFVEDCAVSFVAVLSLDIVCDMILLNFFARTPRASIYAWYIRLAKIFIKNKSDPPLLVSLALDEPAVRTLGNTLLKTPDHHLSAELDIFLVFETADAFVKNITGLLYSMRCEGLC